MVHLTKRPACQAFTVDKFAPLIKRGAAVGNSCCKPIQRAEHLHCPVVDEVSLRWHTVLCGSDMQLNSEPVECFSKDAAYCSNAFLLEYTQCMSVSVAQVWNV